MNRTVATLIILLILLTSLGWAQAVTAKKPVYYDTFQTQSLDPLKWVPDWANHSGSGLMESYREIQNGSLRLGGRNLGQRDSDWGIQYSDTSLDFQNPSAINSITADIKFGHINVNGCATNYSQPTTTIMKITGAFFNAGWWGYPGDDVQDDLYFSVDSNNPKNVTIGNWLPYISSGVTIGTYSIGTPLRVTLAWDQPNHQFVSTVMIKDDPGSVQTVVNSYSLWDTTLPVYPSRYFVTMLYSPNCTTSQASAQMEVFIDNVMINYVPPIEH